MILDIEQRDNEVVISHYNKERKIDFKKYPVSQYTNWIVTHENDRYKDPNLTNWDGRPIKQKKSKSFNKFSQTYFLDRLPKEDQEELFAFNTPRIYFVDIETEIVDGFPKAEEAKSRILTFSIITPERKVIVLGLKDLSQEKIKQIENDVNEHFSNYDQDWEFTYFKFDNEYEMIYSFLGKFMPKFPMMSGWNFVNYDWQYIYNRCKRLKIDMNQFAVNGKLNNNDGRPLHTGILDYMALYDKYDQSVKVKESNALDFVSGQVLNVSKIKYTGSLQELYEQNFQKYVFYNIVDSCLVYYIDQELKCMDVLMALASINKMSIYKADAPVAVTETKMARKFMSRNKRVAIDYNQKEPENTKYDGAFVKKPIVGYYFGVGSVDYKSLYPSSMRQFNTSPEVFIDKINSSEVEERRKNDSNVIVCENGSVYKKEQSVVRDIMDDADVERQTYKKKAKEYFNKSTKLQEYLESLS